MEIDRAAELIGDPLLVEAAAKYPEIATICTSISANLRLLTGDFGRSFEALEAWRTYAGDNNPFLEGSLAWFLADVGDDAGSHAAGLRALDLAISTKEAEARNIAIDMIHLARAALRLGRGLEAIDWLSRVLRLTRTQRSPELTGMALRAAADLALNHGLTRIAILLLDQAIISSGETVWQTDGTSTLLLYGLTLEQIPDIPVADDIFTMAVALSRRQRGAIMIAALSRRAFIADKRGANEDALCLAEEAFRAVLDGRSRIGQETYKLTFIGTSRAVAEQFLGLIVREGRDPGVVFDAIEDWRLPDYRSAEAVWGKFAVDSPLYSVGPFGS
jgi:tetratricopeptide (TPR) repeat protein